VREGETGWLNRSCGAEELARIMAAITPDEVAAMSARVNGARDRIVKPMARHGEEMAAIYAEVLAERQNARAMGGRE
jgi:polynucleotide 5'-kinase involved in rRNA processing